MSKKVLSRKARLHKMAKQGETIYYGVKVGRHTGVFTSWNEVYKETHKFPGAKFKKFDTYEKAIAYLNKGNDNSPSNCLNEVNTRSAKD